MRIIIINSMLGVIIGHVLNSEGVIVTTLPFWLIMICMSGIIVNSLIEINKMKYVVIDVGNMDCGIATEMVGVFSTKVKADEIASKLNKDYHENENDYEHDVILLELPEGV